MTPLFFHDPNHALKYARIEEERRFLLRALPQDLLETSSFIRIIDSHIPGTRLRLRRMESPEGDPIAMKFGQRYQITDRRASIDTHSPHPDIRFIQEDFHVLLFDI